MQELNDFNSVEWLKDKQNKCPPIPPAEGTGICTVAGGPKYLANAYAAIRLLRNKGCQLPIYVYFLGESEAIPEIFNALKLYNVKFFDIKNINSQLQNPQEVLNGWEAKSASVIFCPFQHVMVMDADVFFDKDPTFIFETKEYKEHGAIFWPDYGRLDKTRKIWQITGVDYVDEPEIESGVFFIDKVKNWRAVHLTNEINAWGLKFFYNYIHGDKCSWQFGFKLTNLSYFQVKKPIHSIKGTMVQHWDEEKLFYHRNMAKLSLTDNEKIVDFANEDLIFSYLEDLKKQYDPNSLVAADRDSLAGQKFKYLRIGHDVRNLIFGRDGKIISGRARLEHAWCIKNNKLYLLSDEGKITCELEPYTYGFAGRWSEYEKMDILLLRTE